MGALSNGGAPLFLVLRSFAMVGGEMEAHALKKILEGCMAGDVEGISSRTWNPSRESPLATSSKSQELGRLRKTNSLVLSLNRLYVRTGGPDRRSSAERGVPTKIVVAVGRTWALHPEDENKNQGLNAACE